MKETKVYTGRRNGKHAELMQRLDKALKEQHFAFVFTKQELKEHDRELVKEVCEKIREHLSEQKKSLKDTFSPYSNGKAFIISAVEENLNKIEKELVV